LRGGVLKTASASAQSSGSKEQNHVAVGAIENALHWVLDVTMNEDAMRGKIKKAGWSEEFTLNMIKAAAKI